MTIHSVRVARILWAAMAVLALPIAAVAQTVDVTPVEPLTGQKRWVVDAGYGHMFQTDVNGGGNVSRDSFRASLGARFDITDSVSISPRLIYSLDAYDISNGARPFAWGNIHQYTLLGIVNWDIDEKWSVLGGPVLRLSGEGSSAFDDSFTGGALVGFNYHANPDLSLGFALGVLSQIEDDAGLVPIPMVRWRFLDDFTLHMGISELGGRTGVGPEITWAITDVVDLGFGMQYQRQRYRLDDHGGNSKHIGEETSLPLYLRLGFETADGLRFELFGGLVTGGELRTQDVGGDHTFDRGYDTAGTLGMRAQYRF